jgi:tetratricopeptide (TPR) repeat protein
MAVYSIHDDLEMLCETLNLSKSAAFLFAVSESGPMQQQLMRQVQGYLLAQGRNVLEVRLSPDKTDVLPEQNGISEQINKNSPQIVFVQMQGFEDAGMMSPSLPQDSSLRIRSENARRALQLLNMQRERLVGLGLPVVFWLNSSTMAQVVQHAADLFAARSGIFYLLELQPMARNEVLMAEATIMQPEHRILSLLPPEELRRRSAIYEKRLEEEKSKKAPNLPGIALLYRDLASIWHELGDYERAKGFLKEEVETYRALAKDNGSTGIFLGPLAGSLNRFGMSLSDLGLNEEALEVIRQSLEIYQVLAKTNQQAFLPGLAMSFNNLGRALSNLGRRDESLQATQEAADIYRKLAAANAQAFLPGLAMSLNNLGAMLSNLGRREDALQAAQETIDIRRKLAAANSQTFLPGLAMSLNNLGRALSDLGRREEALQATQEAADIYRKLPAANAQAFLPGLAMSLNNLGAMLSNLGRREDALQAALEAVDIYRKLAKANAQAFLPDLAASLNNLGNAFSDLGQREDALRVTQEAVDIYRKLAKANVQTFLPDLAASLNNLGRALSYLRRREDALLAAKEAAEIYRKLAAANAQAFLPDLAMSLGTYGSVLLALGEHARAARVFREGLEHLVPFYQALPQGFGELAGNFLQNYLKACQQAGEEPDEGLVARFKGEKPEG